MRRNLEHTQQSGAIKQPTLSGKAGRPGRQANGGLIASGTPIAHGGRIAGGAPEIANPRFGSVFAPVVYRSVAGPKPGGLIDRRQQIDPRQTTYAHPFAGGGYHSIASQMLLPAMTRWNGFTTLPASSPSVQPHERGTFFQEKLTPKVKMQFGTNQTGVRPDTAFKRQPRVMVRRAQVRSAPATEHISREVRPPSFQSFNHLVYDPNNSLYGGHGRWGLLKRGANEP